MDLGKYNELTAYRQTENGWYLIDERVEEVLLPNKFVPEDMEKGTEIMVFIYLDNEERLTASTQELKIELNKFAVLEVVDVNRIGAFVDWGLDKQLLVPYSEQIEDMQMGESYIVYLRLDPVTDRLIGSSKINKYIDNEELSVETGEEVDLIVANKSDLGVNVIVNQIHRGLVFNNQIYKKLNYGDNIKGYVQKISEENKLDIVIEKQGYSNVIEPNSKKVLAYLQENNGYMPFNDKSDPADIRMTFEMSKKNFKKALGTLYKQKVVRLESDGAYLLAVTPKSTESTEGEL
jgi:predicted RNA-binding protein (virulence factor B family)